MNTVKSAAADTARTSAGALAEGKRVLRAEARAVRSLAERLGDDFEAAVELIASSAGRVVLSGIGKSGIIARKVAATLTSTGTPAFFLHPVEGLHGDLGIVGPGDVLVLLSRSGSTTELLGLLGFAEARGMAVVALVGDPRSLLARRATAVLDCSVSAEACPLDLAPTSSTTAALAMGDALAAALLTKRNFRPEDFAHIHPGGSLGRQLTLRVCDVMEADDYPAVSPSTKMREVIVPLARMRGTVPVINGRCAVVGVITAGDLTRIMEHTENFLDTPVAEFMNRAPKTVAPSELGSAAVRRMKEHGIMALPVVDGSCICGIVHLHDLLRAGAV